MTRRDFTTRSETFGYDGSKPWAHDALRLLTNVPRAYAPLVDAWDELHPGTRRALQRLAALGFVDHQPAVVVDTRTAEFAASVSAPVARYVLTAKGRRLYAEVIEDLRALEDQFTRLTSSNTKDLARLMSALNLDGSHAKYGLSLPHATQMTNMAPRTARWWVTRLEELGFVRRLPTKVADVREVVPEHWRITRVACRQLTDVLEAFHPSPETLTTAWRLRRRRFLEDIDPARIGISGATDFDHDIEAQEVLADLLRSPRASTLGAFVIEPRLSLPADTSTFPWTFTPTGPDTIFYQPDCELRELRDGKVWRTIVEYERYQSRRDAWSHVERMLGYLHTTTLPFEPAVLRFVLDGPARVRSYVRLIEGFAAYTMDAPDAMPANSVLLMVTSAARLRRAVDPLDDDVWFRIPLAVAGKAGTPYLHDVKDSPYDEYVLG
jgi:hypothetical protein